MASCYDTIKRYASDCLKDKPLSCKKHKWACQRFLNDVKKSKNADFPFYWDEESAQNIVDWFHLLRHSKGVLAGQPIDLTDWQKFRLCQVYGWKRKSDGTRRFRKYFTEVARKNAKSQEEAGVALYEISVMATKNHEVYEAYTAGTKRDQSKIVFNEAKLMLNGSPLKVKFKITNASITHIKTGSTMKALSKEDGKSGDGTNPAILVIDEYHQHKTTEFYDLGLGSNTKEPLTMIITTAGIDLTYPCYVQEYTYCSQILDPELPEVVNDEYMVDILELDTEDYTPISNVGNTGCWIKANPIRMTYDKGIEKISGEYELAKQIPEKMTMFLTKCCNVWVQAKENGYMDMSKWRKCEVDHFDLDTRGWSVYVGFDMSAKIDLTSVAFVLTYMEDGKKKYLIYSHSFIPSREKLAERKAIDKVDYDSWERNGYLTVTDTQIVDQNAVIDYVIKTCEENEWNIECLCFDPANAGKLMMDLSNEGYDVEEVYQSHKSLNESTQTFREQVYDGNVTYVHNPLLNYSMSNAVVRQNQGLIKIDKDATTKRIDPVDALLCAFKLAIYHEFNDNFLETIDAFLEMDW